MLGAIVLAASASTLLGGAQQLPPLTPAANPATAPAGATPAASNAGDGPRYAFEVRDLQVEGLDWRGTLKGRARRLEWKAGVMVWAVGEQAGRDLIAQIQQQSTRSTLLQAPTAVAAAGQPARTLTGSTVQLVVDLERLADGPPGAERGVSYQPVLEQMHNGLDMALSATPDGDGLVVGVNLDETSLQGIHTGSFEDALDGPSSPDGRPILGLFRRRGEGEDPAVSQAGAMRLQASFQVPEVIRSHVEGAWPVKSGESVLISLGARSSSEKWGRAVVVERLVLITPSPEAAGAWIGGAPAMPAAMPAASTEIHSVPGGPPPVPAAMPSVPSPR